MGVERQEVLEREALRYFASCKVMAIGASLLFLFYLSGCLKTVSQEGTPSPEPTTPIASEIEPESSAESGHIVTVSYPADMAVMEFNLVNISLSLPQGSADLIEVEVNRQIKASIFPRRKVECFSVPLELGINKINIKAKKEDRAVDEIALNVFRRSDLVGNYERPPAGFRKDYFHMKDRPQCATCHHVMEPTEADSKTINIETYSACASNDKVLVPTESSCYSCHRGITSYSFVHGPGFVWSCLTCHDSHGEPKYSLKYLVPELCYKCHAEQKRQRSGKKSYHAPYITDKCGICHKMFLLYGRNLVFCLCFHIVSLIANCFSHGQDLIKVFKCRCIFLAVEFFNTGIEFINYVCEGLGRKGSRHKNSCENCQYSKFHTVIVWLTK